MASRLYIDTLQEGSRFTRASKGAFGLVDWRLAGIERRPEEVAACLLAVTQSS